MLKASSFTAACLTHFLQITCPGNPSHLNLRGKGRCASAAQYPKEECRRIMQEGLSPVDTPEGGRIVSSQASKSKDLYSYIFSQKLDCLKVLLKTTV